MLWFLPPANRIKAQRLEALGRMLPMQKPALWIIYDAQVPGSSQCAAVRRLVLLMLQLLRVKVLSMQCRS